MSGSLTWAQARQSPCSGCAAPCCTVLPLHDFAIQRLPDLDYAFYLLNFDRIELALLSDGRFRVHYHARCRNLDPETARCRVHGSPEQPVVCRKYDEHACFYRPIFSDAGLEQVVRLDRGRLEAWSAACRFDEHRNLVARPPHAGLLERLPALTPPMALDAAPIPPAPGLEAWRALARGGAPPATDVRTWEQLQAPCAGCAAWCCSRLTFPHDTPVNASQLDHIRFCLGFPGVEATVDADGRWTIDVRTRCRHLVEDGAGQRRCGVYGQPERPSQCVRFDALSCAYRGRYAGPRPAGLLRVDAAAFAAVAGCFAFDGGGMIVERPGLAALTEAAEAAWAAG